ncbi:MAG: CopG family antitoxin, partial [Bacillota bacterium]
GGRKTIPEFKDLREMAQFWDTHDSTEVEAGAVEDVQYEPKRTILSVRFDAGDMVRLGRMARRLGMDRSTFVRFVVKQYLNGGDRGEARVMEPESGYGRQNGRIEP